MYEPVRLRERTITLLLATIVCGSRVAVGQADVILGGRSQAFPPRNLETGYITTPIRTYGSSGLIAYDGMEKQLWLLPSRDAAPRKVGRLGEGPGEYLGITALWVRGDSIVLTDQGQRRASVLDAKSGRLIQSWRVGLESRWMGASVRPLAVFSQSCWLGVATRALPRRGGAATVETVDVLLLVRESGGHAQYDSITARQSSDAYVRPLGEMAANRIPSATATTPKLAIAADGAGFAVVEAHLRAQSAIVLQVVARPCVAPARRIEVPVSARELSREEVSEMYRKKLQGRPRNGVTLEAAIEDAVRQTSRVDGRFMAPLFSDAFLDATGVVWVEIEGASDLGDYGRPRRWVRMPLRGGAPTTVVGPQDVRLQASDGRRVLGWHTSDDGGAVVELRIPKD